MRITNLPDTLYGDCLVLGIQANPGGELALAHWKAVRWAPKNARSYTLDTLVIHGRGDARVVVHYFTKADEGRQKITDRNPPHPSDPVYGRGGLDYHRTTPVY